MRIYESQETKQRSDFVPQRPHRAPWSVIAAFVATTSFLAGTFIARATLQDQQQLPFGSSAATQNSNDSTMRKPAAMKFFGMSENPVADIVSSASPSVVSIDTTIHKSSGSSELPDLLFSNPSGHPSFHAPDKFEAHGSGSGVVIREDGFILTNAHVVKGADDIKVTLSNKHEYTGKVIGKDNFSDVALVKIDAHGLPVAKMADSHKIRPGDWAIAIGSPLGLNQTVTMGIVSAVGRSLADLNNNVDLIQTDAAINPGNSGGPLLNIHGEVIGINMAIRTDAQNIGFSIPIDVARDAANAILQHRTIQRPYLGISMIDFDEELAQSLGVPRTMSGVLVSKVVPRGPADASGLQEGDLIQRVNDRPVKTGRDVQSIVRAEHVGDRIDLQVYTGGKVRHLNVRLRPYPNSDDDSDVG